MRKKRNLPTLVFAALVALVLTCLPAVPAAFAQGPTDARPQWMDSEIPIGFAHPPIVNRVFRNTTAVPLPRGTVLPAKGPIGRFGLERMISLRHVDLTVGSATIHYPVIGMMRCSNFPDTGEFVKVIASNTVLRRGLKPGEILRAGGFVIEAHRTLKAGQSIPTLRINFQHKQFLFSLEAASPAGADPALTIAGARLSPADRKIALEAWRQSIQSARQGIPR